MENPEELTHREFINSFLYYHSTDSVEVKLYRAFLIDQDSPLVEMLEWLDIFKDEKIGIRRGTPAQMLETILAKKWNLLPNDKDLVVMWHKFNYTDMESLKPVILTYSMGLTGEDSDHTAMAKSVGLPLGIAARLYLTGTLRLSGLFIPTIREIYDPVLKELSEYSISFKEKVLI
jgi:saccharopine dehydrogenase-like NADP-dependent oxidoreductase